MIWNVIQWLIFFRLFLNHIIYDQRIGASCLRLQEIGRAPVCFKTSINRKTAKSVYSPFSWPKLSCFVDVVLDSLTELTVVILWILYFTVLVWWTGSFWNHCTKTLPKLLRITGQTMTWGTPALPETQCYTKVDVRVSHVRNCSKTVISLYFYTHCVHSEWITCILILQYFFTKNIKI